MGKIMKYVTLTKGSSFEYEKINDNCVKCHSNEDIWKCIDDDDVFCNKCGTIVEANGQIEQSDADFDKDFFNAEIYTK